MQMPFHGQSLGMPAQLPSSGDLPGSFPAMGYSHDGSMDSLDCLNDVGLFPPQQSDSMPDYSDLNQAASQMQASQHGFLHSKMPLLRHALLLQASMHLPEAPCIRADCMSVGAVYGLRH